MGCDRVLISASNTPLLHYSMIVILENIMQGMDSQFTNSIADV